MKKTILILVLLLVVGFIYSQYKKASKEEQASKANTRTTAQENFIPHDLMDGSYVISADETVITWRGEAVIPGKFHEGVVSLKEAEMTVIDGMLSGSAVVDMTSITGDAGEGLDSHLRGDDFFAVDRFPEAELTFTEVSEGQFESYLTVRGNRAPINLVPIVVNGIDTMTLEADFSFDRTAHEVNYNSESLFADLKDRAIKDMIDVTVRAEFEMKK